MPVIVELVLTHGKSHYIIVVDVIRHPDVNVFGLLQRRLRETGRVTRTELVNAGRPRTL